MDGRVRGGDFVVVTVLSAQKHTRNIIIIITATRLYCVVWVLRLDAEYRLTLSYTTRCFDFRNHVEDPETKPYPNNIAFALDSRSPVCFTEKRRVPFAYKELPQQRNHSARSSHSAPVWENRSWK